MGYKEERFQLDSSTTGITEADGQDNAWADIWDYKVPLNQWILLKPTDIFSCYLVGDNASEMPAGTEIKVVRRDVANEDARPILSAMNYQSGKEFQDRKKLTTLSLIQPVTVDPEEHIVVMIKGFDSAGIAGGDTDASASFFKLVTTRRRKALE